jgi:hypothetical protein
VRLFTRNGHDWTDRYPLIVEAALKNRSSSFVIDGEAVLLGVDRVSDFDGLHTRKHDAEVADESLRVFNNFFKGWITMLSIDRSAVSRENRLTADADLSTFRNSRKSG